MRRSSALLILALAFSSKGFYIEIRAGGTYFHGYLGGIFLRLIM